MFKAIILLTRNESASKEEFRDWMLVRHSPLARQLPGLRRLVFNIVENEDAPYDGVSELWFDTRDAFDAAYATEIGKAVAGDSLANVRARIRLMVDEQPQVG
jgi:uncharacterized protein (TIGR02118 family)